MIDLSVRLTGTIILEDTTVIKCNINRYCVPLSCAGEDIYRQFQDWLWSARHWLWLWLNRLWCCVFQPDWPPQICSVCKTTLQSNMFALLCCIRWAHLVFITAKLLHDLMMIRLFHPLTCYVYVIVLSNIPVSFPSNKCMSCFPTAVLWSLEWLIRRCKNLFIIICPATFPHSLAWWECFSLHAEVSALSSASSSITWQLLQ